MIDDAMFEALYLGSIDCGSFSRCLLSCNKLSVASDPQFYPSTRTHLDRQYVTDSILG